LGCSGTTNHYSTSYSGADSIDQFYGFFKTIRYSLALLLRKALKC
jgi:hypothetical protein